MLCSENIIPMSLVRCYPIGVIIMDDSGSRDEKIIAIPFDDPTYNGYRDISALPQHIFDEMEHFFTVYKELENAKPTTITEVLGRTAAEEVIAACLDQYKWDFCRPQEEGLRSRRRSEARLRRPCLVKSCGRGDASPAAFLRAFFTARSPGGPGPTPGRTPWPPPHSG